MGAKFPDQIESQLSQIKKFVYGKEEIKKSKTYSVKRLGYRLLLLLEVFRKASSS